MGQSGSSDMVIHYDQVVMGAYQQLINWGMNQDPNNPGPYVPEWLAKNPGNVFLPSTDLDSVFTDLYYNYFVPRIKDLQNLDQVQRVNQEAMDFFIDGQTIADQLAAHNVYLEDEIVQNTLPKLKAGLRDIGAVLTSSFLDSQAMVEMNKVKVLSKYAAELKMKMLDISQNAWMKYLEWAWSVMDYQLKAIESYYRIGMPLSAGYNKVINDNLMFPWTILDQVRAIVGSLNQAQTGRSTSTTPSVMQTAAQYVGMAGALTGMYGAMSNAGLFGAGAGAAGAGAAGAIMEGVAEVAPIAAETLWAL